MDFETDYCATGHRPDELGGYHMQPELVKYAGQILDAYNVRRIRLGMAQGFDQAMAEAACERGIPFIAAIPFKGQENFWPEAAKIYYRLLLKEAEEIVIVSEGGYSPQKMQIRNEWMIDRSPAVLALWNEKKKSGGTFNAVQYAKKMQKPVYNVWPGWESIMNDLKI